MGRKESRGTLHESEGEIQSRRRVVRRTRLSSIPGKFRFKGCARRQLRIYLYHRKSWSGSTWSRAPEEYQLRPLCVVICISVEVLWGVSNMMFVLSAVQIVKPEEEMIKSSGVGYIHKKA